MMETDMVKVKQYIEAHTDEIVEKYKEFINLQDFWRNKDAVTSVAEWLKKEFTAEGAACELIETGEKSGPAFMGIYGKDFPGKPVMFCGHMDTALDSDLYSKSPFRIEEGKAYGPGVLDMKGGIIISLYVLKAMKYVGSIHRPIQFLYAPDEEGCHLYSHVADYIQEHSKGCLFAFNMETGLVNNALCTGRKGRIGVDVSTEGIEAHAGNDFMAGINAIEEAAHKILDFQKLTDLDQGTTVNVGVIRGGTIPNAVPAHCVISVDIRFTKKEEQDRMMQAVQDICAKTYVDGTKTTYDVTSVMAPYENRDDVMQLFHYMKMIAKRYDMLDTSSVQLGGCSDASYVQAAGVPVLCSCGVRGQWNHTLREYALVDSLYERIQWLSAAIVHADEF